MKWRMLMIKWMKVEACLTDESYKLPKPSWSLRKRLLVMTIVYVTLSFIEHGFFLASEISQLSYDFKVCNVTNRSFAEVFIKRHLKFIVERMPFQYSHFIGFFLEYLNFSYTFYWNFLDLFIILVSLGLAILYEKINWRLKGLKRLFVSETTCAEIRSHHVQVSELIKVVNENMNELLIVACFSDGYFILSQAINILT